MDNQNNSRYSLLNFAYIPDIDAQLENLAAMAMEENWEYLHSNSEKKYPILYNYLIYTFERLYEEQKVAIKNDLACFNTGLVSDNQEEIFALFERNRREGVQPWFFKKFCRQSDIYLRDFSPLPEIAHYFDEPAELIFDTRLELRPNLDHIIDDNLSRFPSPYNITENKHALRQLLDGSIRDAVRRARRNYKTAIPQFYRGKIQLLLPLCLLSKNKTDLALVVYKYDQIYMATTVLPLDMAYNNARRIARPDNEWLSP